MNIAVILSGCGLYDGSEIHEATFSLLAIEENQASYACFAPDKEQYHVVDHISGEATAEKRNVLQESARIARGKIQPITSLNVNEYDGLVIPGGFGAAKNLNQWAISGPEGEIDPTVKNTIISFVESKKPIVGLCMGPTVIAQALQEHTQGIELTVGSSKQSSPYDIEAINNGLASIAAVPIEKSITEIHVDSNYKIITAPCYMMYAGVYEVRLNVKQAIDKLIYLITNES